MSAVSDRDKLARLLHESWGSSLRREVRDGLAVLPSDAVWGRVADAVWAAGWRPAHDVWAEGYGSGLHGRVYSPGHGNPYAAPVAGAVDTPDTDAYHAEVQRLRAERKELG